MKLVSSLATRQDIMRSSTVILVAIYGMSHIVLWQEAKHGNNEEQVQIE